MPGGPMRRDRGLNDVSNWKKADCPAERREADD